MREVGLFLTFEHPDAAARDLYASAIDLVVRAEKLGFASAWVVQQHFSSDYGRLPAPLPFLAAAGQRTTRMALGTAVIALTFEHPLLLAEAATVTDALVEGRLRLGLGVGDQDSALLAFGLDPDTRRRRFRTQLARLLTVLEGRAGIAGSVLHPALERSPSELIWLGAQSADTAVLAGRHRLGLLQGRVEPGGEPVAPKQSATVAAYRDAGGSRVTVSRSVWLTDARPPWSDPELAAAMGRCVRAMARKGRGPGTALATREALARLHVFAGTPHDVATQLEADLAGIGPDELLLTLDPGGLPAARTGEKLAWAAADLVPLLCGT